MLKSIRVFTQEELTFRAFTMFNFLGEKRQGAIHDFFDKCSDVKYSVKLAPILNFIFNSNLARIYELQNSLIDKQKQLTALDEAAARYSFVCTQVNNKLQILDTKLWFTGKNASDIQKRLNEIKQMIDTPKSPIETNVSELEILYSNISEQIKVYENSFADIKQFENSSENRKILLDKLKRLVGENPEFSYLVKPINSLLQEMENTIAFSQYTISDKTVDVLKQQKEKVKRAIRRNDSRFICYNVEQKVKAIAVIEEYLSTDLHDSKEEALKLRKEIKELKEELAFLQNADDKTKISKLSDYITSLYASAHDVSSVVEDDSSKKGFRIQYIKRGNILQPMIKSKEKDENDVEQEEDTNYYIGSLARHTLIQLCGYLAFLKMLLAEEKYPLIPILVIDHISKPFDVQNAKAIGEVINQAYADIGKKEMQIFMFDHADYRALALEPDHAENLASDAKTGFNPFYKPDSK